MPRRKEETPVLARVPNVRCPIRYGVISAMNIRLEKPTCWVRRRPRFHRQDACFECGDLRAIALQAVYVAPDSNFAWDRGRWLGNGRSCEENRTTASHGLDKTSSCQRPHVSSLMFLVRCPRKNRKTLRPPRNVLADPLLALRSRYGKAATLAIIGVSK